MQLRKHARAAMGLRTRDISPAVLAAAVLSVTAFCCGGATGGPQEPTAGSRAGGKPARPAPHTKCQTDTIFARQKQVKWPQSLQGDSAGYRGVVVSNGSSRELTFVQWSLEDPAGGGGYGLYYDYFQEYSEAEEDLLFEEAPEPAGADDTELCPIVGYSCSGDTILNAVSAESSADCQAKCGQYNGSCQGWTWVDPYRAVNKTDLGVCYVFYTCMQPYTFEDNGVWTGDVECSARDSSEQNILQGWTCAGEGYSYVGGDYQTLGASSARGCQGHCRSQSFCDAWSWYEKPFGLCYLKHMPSDLASVSSSATGTKACLLL